MTTQTTCSLTIREAFDEFYALHADFAPQTLKEYNQAFTRWERLTGNPAVGEVTNADVAQAACSCSTPQPT